MRIQRSFALLASYLSLELGIVTLVALLLFLSAAGQPALAASPAFVRIIHASPDVGTADVFVDGAPLLSSFQFGAITDYASVPAGSHKVQIALVGKGVGGSVITQTLTVTPGLAYTVAAVGIQATGLSLEVFVDNNRLSPGTARLRVYQLSPDAGAVKVTEGGKTLAQGINYQQASNYLLVSPGAYTFTVAASATNTTLPISTTLSANSVTSIFAVGRVNGTPQLELVSAQVAGLPGLPGTGSDPNPPAQPEAAQPLASWLPWALGTLALLCIGGWGVARRLAMKP